MVVAFACRSNLAGDWTRSRKQVARLAARSSGTVAPSKGDLSLLRGYDVSVRLYLVLPSSFSPSFPSIFSLSSRTQCRLVISRN